MQTGTLEKVRRYMENPRVQVLLVVACLVLSLIIRLILFRVQGCNCDLGTFRFWYNTAADQGLYGFYDSLAWCDYPPFNVYIFWLFGKLSHAIGPYSLDFFIRLPSNLFDLGTAYLIFRFLRPRYSFPFAFGAMAVYALTPATIYDLAVWGQMDSIYTFFMIASLYAAMRSRYELSGGLFSLAMLTKPQSVVLLPVLAYVILRNGGWKRAVSSAVVFFVMIFLVLIPFHWDNPVTFLIDRYKGYNMYPYNSLNAYNFWALLGFWKNDTVSHLGLSYQAWGIIAFVLFALFVLWQFHRRPSGRAPVYAVFLLMFGFFMLMTRMHERYLFPVFALLAMSFSPRHPPWLYAGLMATFFANLAYVMSRLNAGAFIPDGHWSLYVLAPANIILFLYSIWSFWRMQRARPSEIAPQAPARAPPEPKPPEKVPEAVSQITPEPKKSEEEPPPPAPKVVTPRTHILILAVLIVLFLSLSIWNLGDFRAPNSAWGLDSTPRDVVIALGETARVDDVFLLRQDTSEINVELYWGSPGNWTSVGDRKVSGDYRKWERLSLGHETAYVRLLFKSGTGQIGEAAFFSGKQKLAVSKVTVDGDGTTGLALIDEQNLVYNPLSHKSNTIFDEVWFIPTAEETIQLEEPSQWDHPPMSKLLMAAGIGVFGHDPFAWRIPGVLLGALMIPLIYLFAKRMFSSSRAGLIAAVLLTFECMHFAQARIATPEAFILFFVIAMFYFFYRYWQDPYRGGKYLFLSLVFFGLGFSTKWHTMYGFVGMVLLLMVLKWRKPIHRSEVLCFAGGLAAAVGIYMLSYIPYFLADHGLRDFWDMQLRMFDFHRNMATPHPGGSPWYTWPLMFNPVWFYVGYFSDSRAYIATFGNPALWWASIPVMLATIWLVIKQRNKIALFIVVPFLAQWLFFAPITRVIFIYHFYPCVLFIILAAVLWIEWLWQRYKWGKWVVAGYLVLNVACFAFLFPAISGLPMTNGYWDSLKWLVQWLIYS